MPTNRPTYNLTPGEIEILSARKGTAQNPDQYTLLSTVDTPGANGDSKPLLKSTIDDYKINFMFNLSGTDKLAEFNPATLGSLEMVITDVTSTTFLPSAFAIDGVDYERHPYTKIGDDTTDDVQISVPITVLNDFDPDNIDSDDMSFSSGGIWYECADLTELSQITVSPGDGQITKQLRFACVFENGTKKLHIIAGISDYPNNNILNTSLRQTFEFFVRDQREFYSSQVTTEQGLIIFFGNTSTRQNALGRNGKSPLKILLESAMAYPYRRSDTIWSYPISQEVLAYRSKFARNTKDLTGEWVVPPGDVVFEDRLYTQIPNFSVDFDGETYTILSMPNPGGGNYPIYSATTGELRFRLRITKGLALNRADYVLENWHRSTITLAANGDVGGTVSIPKFADIGTNDPNVTTPPANMNWNVVRDDDTEDWFFADEQPEKRWSAPYNDKSSSISRRFMMPHQIEDLFEPTWVKMPDVLDLKMHMDETAELDAPWAKFVKWDDDSDKLYFMQVVFPFDLTYPTSLQQLPSYPYLKCVNVSSYNNNAKTYICERAVEVIVSDMSDFDDFDPDIEDQAQPKIYRAWLPLMIEFFINFEDPPELEYTWMIGNDQILYAEGEGVLAITGDWVDIWDDLSDQLLESTFGPTFTIDAEDVYSIEGPSIRQSAEDELGATQCFVGLYGDNSGNLNIRQADL